MTPASAANTSGSLQVSLSKLPWRSSPDSSLILGTSDER